MEVLLAKNYDKDKIKNLWKYCFTDNDEYVDYYFEKRYDKKNNYIIKQDDEVICSLMANDYTININNNKIKSPYIVGVSSIPVGRGSGYASNLIKDTLKSLGTDVAMLMPIDTNIYTRYGFANIYDMLEIELPLDRIRSNKSTLRLSEKFEISDLMKIYNEVSKKIDYFFERDENYYKNFIDEIILEDGHIFVCYDNDNPIGYMVFYPKHILGSTGFVREIFSTDVCGYDKLFSIIKSHFTQVNNVIIHTYINSDVFFYLQSDNKISYKLKPFMMSRILNVENAIKNLKIKSDIKLRIIDDIIEKNNKVFDFKTMKSTDEKEDLIVYIYDFTKLYFGYIDAKNFLFLKNLNVSQELVDKLCDVFPKKQSYFNDYV